MYISKRGAAGCNFVKNLFDMNYSFQNSVLFDMQKIENEFKKIFLKYIDIPIGRIGQSTVSKPNQTIYTDINASRENKDYIGTSYFFKCNEILHFTSLKNFISITNEKSIRLYNLNNSNDPEEYSYINDKIKEFYLKQGKNNEDLKEKGEYVKNNSYILSCTSINEINNPKFWEDYADNGRGIAIIFKIRNNKECWRSSYLSEVKYDNLENWQQFNDELHNLVEKYPLHDFKFEFDQIFSFHKNEEKYSWEKEIRLLCQPEIHDFNPLKKMIKYDINKSNKLVKYLILPLYAESNTDENNCNDYSNRLKHLDLQPFLEIKEIFISNRFAIGDKNLYDSIDILNEIIGNNKDLKTYISQKNIIQINKIR